MAVGVIPRGTLYPSLSEVFDVYESNATLAQFDLVNLQNGQLEVVDAGESILGYVNQKTAVTSSSTNVEVNITPFMQIIMDSDETGDNLAQDCVGELYNTAGGTGAQVVDISETVAPENPAVSAQVLCLKQNDGSNWDAGAVREDLRNDTSVGLFLVVEHQFGPRMGA